jgi:response regulator RpfG family c-di-GMP phosphodiesterase
MFVHIVADDQNKISELRSLFESQDRITSALLNHESSVPKECDAMIIAVDLRNADNIAILKEVSATSRNTRRKIFVIDRKVRLLAAQAYALGATHVLFRPVYQPSLLAALNGSGKSNAVSEDDHQGRRTKSRF